MGGYVLYKFGQGKSGITGHASDFGTGILIRAIGEFAEGAGFSAGRFLGNVSGGTTSTTTTRTTGGGGGDEFALGEAIA